MKTQSIHKGKIIALSGTIKNKTVLYKSIFFITIFLTLLYISVSIRNQVFLNLFNIIFVNIFLVIFFIILYHILNKASKSEKIIITTTDICIEKTKLFGTKKMEYNLNYVSNFRHIEEPNVTEHPLAGKTFDFMGFQKTQEVINVVHGDDRLAFDYNGTTISFGPNIYSWNFEEIQKILIEITGKDYANNTDVLSSFITNI